MGTLGTVRDRFLKASGRFDLGTLGGEDSGANQFINSAQRFLDRTQETPQSTRRFQTDYVVGQESFEIQDLMAPRDIHITTELSGSTKLYFKEYDELFRTFDPTRETDRGLPLYYSFSTAGLCPSQADLNLATYEEQFTRNFQDLKFGNFWQTKMLVIRPVPDTPGTLVLTGRFYSPMLREDEDRSWWTELGEEALLTASLLYLEISMRNQSAARFWQEQLGRDLNSIDNELIWLDSYDKPVRLQG